MTHHFTESIGSIYRYSTPIKRYSFISLMLMQYAVYFGSSMYYSTTIFWTQFIGLSLALILAVFHIWPKKLKASAPLIWIICIIYSGLYPCVYTSFALGLESFSLLHILLNLLILSAIVDSLSLMYILLISICSAIVVIFISSDYIGMVKISKLESFITIFLCSISFVAQRRITSISNSNIKKAMRSLASEISSPISNLVMLSSALENLSSNITIAPSKEDLDFLRIISRNIFQDSNATFNNVNSMMQIYIKQNNDLSKQSVKGLIKSLLSEKIHIPLEDNKIIFNAKTTNDIFFHGSKNAFKDMLEALLIEAFKNKFTTVELLIEGRTLRILQKGNAVNKKELSDRLLPPEQALKFNLAGYTCSVVMKKLNGHVTCNIVDIDNILFVLTFPDIDC